MKPLHLRFPLINKDRPAAVLMIVDQTARMADVADGNRMVPRSYLAAEVANRLLGELLFHCVGDEDVRDYFHVGAIGYGFEAVSLLRSESDSLDILPMSKIVDLADFRHEAGPIQDDYDEVDENVIPGPGPVWVTPVAEGGASFSDSLTLAKPVLRNWVSDHRNRMGFIPVVIHITGEELNEGDFEDAVLLQDACLGVETGTFFLQLHIPPSQAPELLEPYPDRDLPHEYARAVFELSSLLPEPVSKYMKQLSFRLPDATGGALTERQGGHFGFLSVGTRSASWHEGRP